MGEKNKIQYPFDNLNKNVHAIQINKNYSLVAIYYSDGCGNHISEIYVEEEDEDAIIEEDNVIYMNIFPIYEGEKIDWSGCNEEFELDEK